MSLLPGCRDMSRILSDARDSGRPLGLRARAHLWVCDVCRRVLAQFGVLGEAAAAEPAGGPLLSSAAKQRMKSALDRR